MSNVCGFILACRANECFKRCDINLMQICMAVQSLAYTRSFVPSFSIRINAILNCLCNAVINNVELLFSLTTWFPFCLWFFRSLCPFYLSASFNLYSVMACETLDFMLFSLHRNLKILCKFAAVTMHAHCTQWHTSNIKKSSAHCVC